MLIAVDKNQVTGSHRKSNDMNHRRLVAMGHKLYTLPLPYGDYAEITEEVAETIARRGTKFKKMDIVNDVKIAVDRKNSLDEVCGNLCSSKDEHERFREELIRAQKAGCKFYVMVENTEGIRSIQDILKWSNTRLARWNKTNYMHSIGKWTNVKLSGKKPPCDNARLMKTMFTCESRYGCKFVFVSPSEAADKIVELLSMKGEDK